MLFTDDAMTDEELRAEAVNDRDLHDPAKQEDNGYERCARCHFTRHPCETFFYADAVIKLLDRAPETEATGVRLPASSPADTDTDTTESPPSTERF